MTQDTALATHHRFWLDDGDVEAFLRGALSTDEEAQLARQVASVLLGHGTLPNHTVGNLSAIQRHLGGPDAVLGWLSRFAGETRIVATVTELGDLLDLLSDVPAVVAALRATRSERVYPDGLVGYIIEDSDETTLASLAHVIEMLAVGNRTDEAVRVATAAARMLVDVVRLAAERDPGLGAMSRTLQDIRRELQGVTLSP